LLDAAFFAATSYGISCPEAIVRYQIACTARFVQAGEDFLVSTATLEGTSLVAFLQGRFAFLRYFWGGEEHSPFGP
jgi:hypothetical protein